MRRSNRVPIHPSRFLAASKFVHRLNRQSRDLSARRFSVPSVPAASTRFVLALDAEKTLIEARVTGQSTFRVFRRSFFLALGEIVQLYD